MSDAKYPIIVFINKLDREGKDAFDLLDEVEEKLKLKSSLCRGQLVWDNDFRECTICMKKLMLFSPHGKQLEDEVISIEDLNDQRLQNMWEKRQQMNCGESSKSLHLCTRNLMHSCIYRVKITRILWQCCQQFWRERVAGLFCGNSPLSVVKRRRRTKGGSI